jgi:hypothetical protein
MHDQVVGPKMVSPAGPVAPVFSKNGMKNSGIVPGGIKKAPALMAAGGLLLCRKLLAGNQ